MGEQTLTLKQAWDVYERWLGDPRGQFYPEPRVVDAAFRRATAPFAKQRASCRAESMRQTSVESSKNVDP
jgi:hypothetical protein